VTLEIKEIKTYN